MTFLPIVERELRVAARKPGTFWVRVAAALVVTLIGSTMLFLFGFGGSPMGPPGAPIFSTLSQLSLFAAAAAGLFLTSNALSEEKREGTLGFLFLTDLRGYDVAGGKLLASSLRGFYALLGTFPILAMTILAGGVENAWFWRTCLGLVNVLFWSLACGLFVSALSRDDQKAMAGTLFLLAGLWMGGPCLDGAIAHVRGRALQPFWSLTSPAYVVGAALAPRRSGFWPGLLVTQMMSWGLLAATSALVPRTWRERPREWAGHTLRELLAFGPAGRQRRRRRKWLARNPIAWLAGREAWPASVLWVAWLGLAAGYGIDAARHGGLHALSDWMTWFRLAKLGLFIGAAAQAGRFFAEARRSGWLELWLVSPLRPRQLVGGQWRAWLGACALPLTAFAALFGLACVWAKALVWGVLPFGSSSASFGPPALCAAASAVDMLADLAALAWVGLWMGLTSKNATRAALRTLAYTLVIPWLAIILLFVLGAVGLDNIGFFKRVTFPPWWSVWCNAVVATIPATLVLVKDAALILWARHRLYHAMVRRAAGDSH